MLNDFYVYAHYKADTGEIFYIGKGSKNRAYTSIRRSKFWYNIVNKHGLKVEILHNNLDEIFAYELEANYIACYGKRYSGGCLINLSDGFDGCIGYYRSNYIKNKISKSISGKNHPMYGKTHTKESKLKMSKSHKGKLLSEQHKKTLSKVRRGKPGKPLTEEIKRKISLTLKGRIISKEVRLNMSKAQLKSWKRRKKKKEKRKN